MQDPTAIRDLVGALGVPGALGGFAVAFYFGARSVLLLMHKRNGTEGGGGGNVSYRDSVATERVIMANIDKTRHDLNGGLAKVLSSLQVDNEKQTDRVVERLDAISKLIEQGNDRRRELR